LSRHESSLASQSDKLFKFFSRPNISMQDMLGLDPVSAHVAENQLDREVLEQVEIQVKYSGYIEKEKNNAAKLTKLEGIRIPENFDYSRLKSLSYEAREKLSQIQPRTISQASRISGVSPNDISVLLVFMGR
jgi:tRNA uridine 5-carboxymethylaminomethyl modification enzyme